MNRQNVLSAMLACFLTTAVPAQAQAVLVSAQESSVGIQAALINSDFGAVATIFGSAIGSTIDYQATTLVTGWSGTLTGIYLGKNVNFTYTGNLSPSPGAILPGPLRELMVWT